VKQGLIANPSISPGTTVIISVAGQDGLKEQLFLLTCSFRAVAAPERPVGLAANLPFHHRGYESVVDARGCRQAVLSCYGLGGGLLQTLDITTDLLTDAGDPNTAVYVSATLDAVPSSLS